MCPASPDAKGRLILDQMQLWSMLCSIHQKPTLNPTRFVTAIYTAVDALDAKGVVAHLTDDVRFQLGNSAAISGQRAVEEANTAFFKTIKSMQHTITNVWSLEGSTLCEGSVRYVRDDLSQHEVPFAAHFDLTNGQVADYRVYVDISGL